MKRIALFLLTNLAVLVALSIAAHLFGLNRFIGASGLDFGALLAFAALFGFGGAFLSLAISKWSAKMAHASSKIRRAQPKPGWWIP
jgi:heat shock protein HtpX